MLRTTNKAVKERIKRYILDGANFEGYDEIELDPADFPAVCRAILDTCKSEKKYQRYSSRFEMFKDWAQGLPSVLNTLYYYNVSAVDLLGEWLEETEAEKAKFAEQEAEERITWLIFRELERGARI